jgi:hypothetical protein
MQKRPSGIVTFLGLALGLVISAESWAQPAPPCQPCCWPPPCECNKVTLTPSCCSVTLRVDGIANATGWGSHFSLSEEENGHGGFYPECYILTSTPNGDVRVSCHDGFLDDGHHVNNFRLPLGLKSEVDYIEFSVGQRGVQVTAQRRARSAFTEEAVPYQINAFFPLRESSGFCSGKTLYIQKNGVLNDQVARSGSGYNVSVRTP